MKYALVTGASRGIGKAISKQLSQDGFSVIINYRSNDEEANKTLSEIKEAGGKAELLKFDVANVEAIENALETWANNHEGEYIEVLVNNAGIRKDNLQVFMQNDEWVDVINTNLNSFFYVTRRLLKDMLVKKNGRIINIVSLSGLTGVTGQTNYSAAKAGVIGATRSLAKEIARKRVTVNCVAPGFIKTDMTEDLDEKQFRNVIPMRRFGKAEEVANLISFLASEKSSYITGEVISVSGGIN